MLACSTLFTANLRWVTFLNRVFQIQLTLAIMKSISILPLWSQLTFRHYKTITHQNWLKSNTKHVADLILPCLYQKLHADRHLVDLRHQSSWGSILRPGFSPNRKKMSYFSMCIIIQHEIGILIHGYGHVTDISLPLSDILHVWHIRALKWDACICVSSVTSLWT